MRINVIAHPNSKKERIENDLLGEIHAYVTEPPIDGRANAAITTLLSKHFKIPRSKVILISGEKSKTKTFSLLQPDMSGMEKPKS